MIRGLMRWSGPFVIALAACRPDLPGLDTDAAMLGGDARHSGAVAASGVPSYGGLAWRYQTGGAIRGVPVLAGGVVYVGSSDGALYALSESHGRLAWRFDAGQAINGTPAVLGSRVFVITHGGAVHAVERRTGRGAWTWRCGPALPLLWSRASGDVLSASPTVGNGGVAVGCPSGVVALLDAGSGRVRWEFHTGGRIRSAPAIADSLVIVGAFDGVVYGIDLATGQQRWRYATEGATARSADFGFDRNSIQSSPAVVAGTAYVGSRDGYLYALDERTGALRWRTGHDMSWVIGAPAVSDSTVIATTSDGRYVHGLNTATGAERWRVTTAAAAWSTPVVAGGLVYATDGRGTVVAVDPATGIERWRVLLPSGIRGGVAAGNGLLVGGAGDGGVYALRAGEGTAGIARAVYWDSTVVQAVTVTDHVRVRDFFARAGYSVLDATAFAAFLDARAADRHPSVVVCAADHLTPGADVKLRRYLETGGKIVWLGIPPLLWPADPRTGDRGSYAAIDTAATARLLGVSHAHANLDRTTVRPTDAGKSWGLNGWWLSAWSAEPDAVDEILASDEAGLAAAWVKRFGGPAGTGFVRVDPAGASQDMLPLLWAVAEYRPAADRR